MPTRAQEIAKLERQIEILNDSIWKKSAPVALGQGKMQLKAEEQTLRMMLQYDESKASLFYAPLEFRAEPSAYVHRQIIDHQNYNAVLQPLAIAVREELAADAEGVGDIARSISFIPTPIYQATVAFVRALAAPLFLARFKTDKRRDKEIDVSYWIGAKCSAAAATLIEQHRDGLRNAAYGSPVDALANEMTATVALHKDIATRLYGQLGINQEWETIMYGSPVIKGLDL